MGGLAAMGGLGISFLGALIVALGFIVAGLGQVFEALKEISLNTRAMAAATNPQHVSSRQTYGALGFITSMLTLLSAVIVLSGALAVALGFAAMGNPH